MPTPKGVYRERFLGIGSWSMRSRDSLLPELPKAERDEQRIESNERGSNRVT
jgi:hypothetical protein